MHISYMKSLGIEAGNDESLLLALENIVGKTNFISQVDSYYYIGHDFTDIPSEDKHVFINNNDWFKKSTINSEYIDSVISSLDETDGIMEEPVRDFLALLQEVDLELLRVKVFEID